LWVEKISGILNKTILHHPKGWYNSQSKLKLINIRDLCTEIDQYLSSYWSLKHPTCNCLRGSQVIIILNIIYSSSKLAKVEVILDWLEFKFVHFYDFFICPNSNLHLGLSIYHYLISNIIEVLSTSLWNHSFSYL